MSEEIEYDILRVRELVKILRQNFIDERLKDGSNVCWFDKVPRKKLKTMEDNNKSVPVKTSQGKLIQYKEQNDLAFKLFVNSQIAGKPLDLEVLIAYWFHT